MQPKGFPPYVDPCYPGLIRLIILSSQRTAETGINPPESAFPNNTISGLTLS